MDRALLQVGIIFGTPGWFGSEISKQPKQGLEILSAWVSAGFGQFVDDKENVTSCA
jgi:hypothetical protein